MKGSGWNEAVDAIAQAEKLLSDTGQIFSAN